MKLSTFLIATGILFSSPSFAFKGDLTSISKRPGKNEIFVAGEFKPIVVLNGHKGTALRSFKLEQEVKSMEFTPDGSVLLAANYNKLSMINADNGTVIKTISGSNFYLFERSNYILDVDRWGSKSVKVISSKDGSLVTEIKLDFTPTFAALSKDDKKVYIFSEKTDIKDEKKLITKIIEPVSGYNTFNKAYLEQQKDGKGCTYLVFDLDKKTEALKKTLAFTPDAGSFSHTVSTFEGNVYALNWDMLLKIDINGQVTPVEVADAGFSYAATSTANGRFILQAGSEDGLIYDCKENKTYAFGESSFPLFPIYAKDACTSNDTLFLLSSNYEIKALSTNGNLLNTIKINTVPECKFGLLYSNGFSKKEDRDKEAAIINAVYTQLGISPFDLEQYAGKSDVLIGEFESYEKAYKVMEMFKNNKLQYLVKTTLTYKN